MSAVAGACFISILLSWVIGDNSTVTGPNVCSVNVTVTRISRQFYTAVQAFRARCLWGRCLRYRTIVRTRHVTTNVSSLVSQCCSGFRVVGDTCVKGMDSTTSHDSDVIGYIWPPVVGLVGVLVVSIVVVFIVMKKRRDASRDSQDNGIFAGDNSIYLDALPSTSHSYESLDSRKLTMSQNIYDSIDIYNSLQNRIK